MNTISTCELHLYFSMRFSFLYNRMHFSIEVVLYIHPPILFACIGFLVCGEHELERCNGAIYEYDVQMKMNTFSVSLRTAQTQYSLIGTLF